MRGYAVPAVVLFVAWLAAAVWIISLLTSGRSDLGSTGNAIAIAAILLCTVYIAWVLWKRRPEG